jgi:hypothetical protein
MLNVYLGSLQRNYGEACPVRDKHAVVLHNLLELSFQETAQGTLQRMQWALTEIRKLPRIAAAQSVLNRELAFAYRTPPVHPAKALSKLHANKIAALSILIVSEIDSLRD